MWSVTMYNEDRPFHFKFVIYISSWANHWSVQYLSLNFASIFIWYMKEIKQVRARGDEYLWQMQRRVWSPSLVEDSQHCRRWRSSLSIRSRWGRLWLVRRASAGIWIPTQTGMLVWDPTKSSCAPPMQNPACNKRTLLPRPRRVFQARRRLVRLCVHVWVTES